MRKHEAMDKHQTMHKHQAVHKKAPSLRTLQAVSSSETSVTLIGAPAACQQSGMDLMGDAADIDEDENRCFRKGYN